MSPKVIVDPAELRSFAATLKRFTGELKSSTSNLKAQFRRLDDTWRDQEHAKFAQEFEQTMRVLDRFIQIAEQHTPFLLRKAQRAEDYLRQK
jgi:uncharacterized protein YukE